MTLALVLGAMALAAALLLAAPLFARRPAPKERRAFDRAIYRDQLAEVQRDLERGLIAPADAAAARTEIERRLLRTESAGGPASNAGREGPTPSRLARALIVALMAAVPAAGGGLYLMIGSPGLPDVPASSRAAAEAPLQILSDAELADTVALIERRLEDHPQELQGWAILSTAYLRLGRGEDAERALERALALSAGDREGAARIAVNFGEALVGLNDGRIGPSARDAFERAQELAPADPSPRYYLGLERLQSGDARGALAIWRRLVRDAPADATWREALQRRIEEIAAARGVDLESLDAPAPPEGP